MVFCINHQEKTQFSDQEVSNSTNEMANQKQVRDYVIVTS